MALPAAFLSRMECLLGTEYPAFLQAMQAERAFGLRLNPLKATRFSQTLAARFGLRPVPWSREGYYYDPATRPGRHPYYEAGLYYIQEPSAMAVGDFADPQPGMHVLDLCAAPGGKTTHLAGRMLGQGILVANEIHPGRAKILSQSVERAGITNCMVTNETPQRLAERLPEYFDCIVVDAPCSGEGMFRKDEVAIAEWTPETPVKCAARQDEILDCAVRMLRPGGRLVYSTCTFAPEEDEGSVQRLIDRCPEMEVAAVPGDPCFEPGHPEWTPKGSTALTHTFRLFPHRLHGEGHFVAVLQRKGDGRIREAAPACTLPGQKIPGEYQAFAAENLAVQYENFTLRGDQLWALPAGMPDDDGLRVLRQGLQLGTRKKGRFEPSHALALALRPDDVRRAIDFPAESSEIVRYLKGETLPVQAENGWTLVCTDGYALGWGKVSNGVLKNHYPKGLRWK